jgi:hypothetical protein
VEATPSAVSGPINDPPTTTITTSPPDEEVKGIFEISGSASDNDGTIERIEMKIDDGVWFVIGNDSSWKYDLDTTTLSNGDHTIYTRAYDGEDYSEEESITVTVANPLSTKGDESVFEETWFWVLIVLVIIVIVAILLLVMRGQKGSTEEDLEGEIYDVPSQRTPLEEVPTEEQTMDSEYEPPPPLD